MLYEHHTEPVLPFQQWLRRVARSVWIALSITGGMLALGIIGYHTLGNLSWIDSIVEASMILGGMGPVSPLTTDAVKLFASAYALLSGLFVIGATGIILSPWLHRFLHHFYADRRKPSADGKTRRVTDGDE
jgi:hypothetical protein